jgi:pimeloyl-ACP methyl ester carboxylesterase
MSFARRLVFAAATVTLMAAAGCTGGNGTSHARSTPAVSTSTTVPRDRPLPPRVRVRPEPEGVTLSDPEFEPLPGAHADFGRLGGAVYQVEVPAQWNGRLVLFMHGFEDFRPEAGVSAPDIRRYLIGRHFAWGASSFSSTSLIPGRAADETAALWDYFARKYRRPTRTYVTGQSMGGAASHIAAERYADRFDGALALCGNAGNTNGLMGTADYFAAGAYAAGVTQAEFDTGTGIGGLIRDRIRPALRDPIVHKRFEDIMLDLTGGPRPFDREGFRAEEDTNWRRTELAVAARIAPNRATTYRLGPLSTVSSDQFNRAVIRLPVDNASMRAFVAGNDVTGALRIPLLTLHTTGDGQVPIEQARILRRRVDRAGKGDLLVERVIRDPSHCGFASTEWAAALEALVGWVEQGVKPPGTNVMVDDLRTLDRTFELAPRPGTPEADAVPGARDRALLRGSLSLDGAPLDAQWLGAVVRRDGLITPCQYTLPPVENGRYEITVLADAEASGCGVPGAQVLLWTFARNKMLYSREAVAWPGNGKSPRFDASFSTSAPDGAAPPTLVFSGEVFHPDGRQLPPGTRVEAFVRGTRCGIASTRRTGNFSGYILAVVGPDSVAGCERGATLTFRIDGRAATDTSVNELGRAASLDLTMA